LKLILDDEQTEMALVSKPEPEHAVGVRPLRIAIIARRFWPYSGSTELAVAELAAALHRAGHHIEVLTIRWEKTWPAFFQFQEFNVRRVNRTANTPWSSFRYTRNLQRQIHDINADGLIVFGIGEEAGCVAKSFSGEIPYVLRLDSNVLGCRAGRPNLTSRQIRAIDGAASVMVQSKWTVERFGLHPAIDLEKFKIVPDGAFVDQALSDPKIVQTPAKKGTSRISISDAHPVLMIEPMQPLIVCGSPMNGDDGMLDLINAWPHVLKRFANARLWILGDGLRSRPIWDKIMERNLVHSIIMPGNFDDLEEVFYAADVYVHPLRTPQSCSFLERAMAAGVCCVSTLTDATSELVNDDVDGLVIEPGNPRVLAEALVRALDDSNLQERLGRAAANSRANIYDVQRVLNEFVSPLVPSDNLLSKD
jgi:glycosyltransferase involved in cell wall biosynthesis